MNEREGGEDPASAGAGEGPAEAPRTCAWCGAPASSPDATSCSSCGAALAQRASIGDLAIPGLTAVDAALQDFDKRPLHLRGPSPSQGMAPALIVGAVAGGPIGLAAIGGVAAVAAAEYLGTRRGGTGSLEEIGRPSEVALRALEHIDETNEPAPGAPATAGLDAAADDGRSIWRDLPGAGLGTTTNEQEEGSANGR